MLWKFYKILAVIHNFVGEYFLSKFTCSQRLRSQAICSLDAVTRKAERVKIDGVVRMTSCTTILGVDKRRILTTLFVYGKNNLRIRKGCVFHAATQLTKRLAQTTLHPDVLLNVCHSGVSKQK